MKFKTISGTEYVLRDVEMVVMATGEECPAVGPQGVPVAVSYVGQLARLGGRPMTSLLTGRDMDVVEGEEFHSVEFSHMPEVGVRFTYFHPVWFGCYSTAVKEIEVSEKEIGEEE